jgi:methionyl-tRNA synthetase
VRFALLREGIVAEDGDFNPSTLEQRASKECADTFGNLASRLLTARFMPLEGCVCVAPIALALPWGGALGQAGLVDPWLAWGRASGGDDPSLHPSAQHLPVSAEQAALLAAVDALAGAVEQGMAAGQGPSPGLAAIVAALQEANRVFTRAEPWKHVARQEEVAAWAAALAAHRGGSGGSSGSGAALAHPRLLPPGSLLLQPHTLQLAALTYTLAETLRVCAILLQLATPRAAATLLAHLGFPAPSASAAGHALAQWGAARVGAARPHDFCVASAPLPVLFPKARPEKR